jgi:carbonic anhydrase
MSTIDELLENNARFAEAFDDGDLAAPPARRIAIVTCMDARLDPHRILGLAVGDAHVIANAGGVITDDAIRSLAVSQQILGTEEVILIHHTDCGMEGFDDDRFKQRLEDATGKRPEWEGAGFSDLDGAVRHSIQRITESPFIPNRGNVRGFVYEVETGRLREVG